MSYQHTQSAPLGRLLAIIGMGCVWGVWIVRHELAAAMIFSGLSITFFVLAGLFDRLTIQDEGEWLAVRFGPIPVFSRRIYYHDIMQAERDRTSWIDGWGIHYLPGRGTTWNIWGFDCVKLTVNGRILRLGTDDADNLIEFLNARVAEELMSR